MPKAGAVGGMTPALPTGTPAGASTGPQDSAAKPPVPSAEVADGKPTAPPLPETSGRAPPETPPRAAITLAATLAGLKPGQELRGIVRLLPGQTQAALLKTPQGDFLIDPAGALEPDSPVSLVLLRADRTISALLLTTGRAALDPPRPVQLTLVSLPEAPAPPAKAPAAKVMAGADAVPAEPGLARPEGAPPPKASAPAPNLTSLLPGEAIFLRGGGQPSRANTPAPPAPLPEARAGQVSVPPGVSPAPTLARATSGAGAGSGLAASAPRPLLHAPMLPDAPEAGAVSSVPAKDTPALAALFERGVLPLALYAAETGKAPVRMLAASLLAAAAPGETSPLTHPPASSPLARLAEAGRLITAIALPPQEADVPLPPPQTLVPVRGDAAMPAGKAQPPVPAPPALETGAAVARPEHQPTNWHPPVPQAATGSAPKPAPAPVPMPSQPVQLSINGTGARVELPAGSPAPAPGTQLVFLVTHGHKALRALPAASPNMQVQAQIQAAPVPANQAAENSTLGRSASAAEARPAVVPSTPQPPRLPQAAERGSIPLPKGPNTPAGAYAPAPGARAGEARVANARVPEANVTGAHVTESRAGPVASPPPAAAGMPVLQEQPDLLWMPGMPLPASLTPVATAAAAISGGEALLLAVMQALGRKGFATAPRDLSNQATDAEGDAQGAGAAPGTAALARVLQTAAASHAATAARTEQAQDAPIAAASVPEALPFAMTLQTPQGQVPLVFLVWQPVRADEESRNGGEPGEDEAEVCFAVDVEFESIGRLRLRGAVGRTHLDLGVETEQALGATLQHAASRDFTQAIAAGGMTGTLVFRHQQDR